MRITFHKNIRIHFKINQTAQVTEMQDIIDGQGPSQVLHPVQSLTYNIVSSPKPLEPKKSVPQTYSYSIIIQ